MSSLTNNVSVNDEETYIEIETIIVVEEKSDETVDVVRGEEFIDMLEQPNLIPTDVESATEDLFMGFNDDGLLVADPASDSGHLVVTDAEVDDILLLGPDNASDHRALEGEGVDPIEIERHQEQKMLSAWSYDRVEDPTLAPPQGYSVVSMDGFESSLDGFSAYVLHNETTNEYSLTFVGTDGVGDVLLSDGPLSLGLPALEFADANRFYHHFIDKVLPNQANHDSATIYATGHSLGGALAQYVTYLDVKSGNNQIEQVTTFNGFNIDGIQTIDPKVNWQDRSIAYSTQYDIVSAYNPTSSEQRIILDDPRSYGELVGDPSNVEDRIDKPLLFLCELTGVSLHSHSLSSFGDISSYQPASEENTPVRHMLQHALTGPRKAAFETGKQLESDAEDLVFEIIEAATGEEALAVAQIAEDFEKTVKDLGWTLIDLVASLTEYAPTLLETGMDNTLHEGLILVGNNHEITEVRKEAYYEIYVAADANHWSPGRVEKLKDVIDFVLNDLPTEPAPTHADLDIPLVLRYIEEFEAGILTPDTILGSGNDAASFSGSVAVPNGHDRNLANGTDDASSSESSAVLAGEERYVALQYLRSEGVISDEMTEQLISKNTDQSAVPTETRTWTETTSWVNHNDSSHLALEEPSVETTNTSHDGNPLLAPENAALRESHREEIDRIYNQMMENKAFYEEGGYLTGDALRARATIAHEILKMAKDSNIDKAFQDLNNFVANTNYKPFPISNEPMTNVDGRTLTFEKRLEENRPFIDHILEIVDKLRETYPDGNIPPEDIKHFQELGVKEQLIAKSSDTPPVYSGTLDNYMLEVHQAYVRHQITPSKMLTQEESMKIMEFYDQLNLEMKEGMNEILSLINPDETAYSLPSDGSINPSEITGGLSQQVADYVRKHAEAINANNNEALTTLMNEFSKIPVTDTEARSTAIQNYLDSLESNINNHYSFKPEVKLVLREFKGVEAGIYNDRNNNIYVSKEFVGKLMTMNPKSDRFAENVMVLTETIVHESIHAHQTQLHTQLRNGELKPGSTEYQIALSTKNSMELINNERYDIETQGGLKRYTRLSHEAMAYYAELETRFTMNNQIQTIRKELPDAAPKEEAVEEIWEEEIIEEVIEDEEIIEEVIVVDETVDDETVEEGV